MTQSARRLARVLALAVAMSSAGPAFAEAALSAQALLESIDERMSVRSDYRGTVRIRTRLKNGTENVAEVQVFRRDASEDLLLLFTRPQQQRGGGYLRIGRNLWEYDPVAGRWERRTRRSAIVSTFTCESDFDRSRLAEEYEGKEEGAETVGGVTFRKLYLTGRPGKEVTFPIMRLWVDPDGNVVRRIGYAPSGRVLRADTIRGYQRLKDPSTGKYFFHLKEVVEEIEELGVTVIVRYDEVQLSPLQANMFTKAWFETRTRRN